jgi:hypothetical protein
MEMYLQLGSGMMQMSRDLVEEWGGGTVILSPRDLEPKQLTTLATDINDLPSGQVLLDPQFYLPNSAHKRLVSHAYWPDDYESGGFWGGPHLRGLLAGVLDLNSELKTSAVILPALYADKIDDDWLERQGALIAEARRMDAGARFYATLPLSADVLRSDEAVHEVLEAFGAWSVDGAYVVCEHPNGDYLVKDPLWISNVVDLAAGIKLKGRTVVLGYASHQLLIAAIASADAIASGTWMNVRSFQTEKFEGIYDDERKTPTDWFYAPRVLSEYKEGALDTAYKLGLMEHMTIPPELACSYVDGLLSGLQPSAVGLDQSSAFKHYLACLHSQVALARGNSFAETVELHAAMLDDVERRLTELHAKRIRGLNRDFKDIVDPHRQALSIVESVRGPLLERAWRTLAR